VNKLEYLVFRNEVFLSKQFILLDDHVD